MNDPADFIIAGGGSAGCVLASRLSEDRRNRVVLLEAGPPGDGLLFKIPAGMNATIADAASDWFFTSEPDPSAGDRQMLWFAGKVLGGGSAINGMVYTRGARRDYDGWAAAGCTGWSWDDVLPFFKRSEAFDGPASEWHSTGGLLGVSQLRAVHPLAEAFIRTCGDVGMRELEDYCGGDVDGVYRLLATQRNGLRSSSATAFLGPARARANLRVVTGAVVDKVLFEGLRAVGVRYLKDGVVHEIRAHGEIILSAGAMQSPVTLMRSGVGPVAHLREHGLEAICDIPEVGRNLHEHPNMANSRLIRMPSYNVRRNPFRLAKEGLAFLLARSGMLTTCAVHAQAYARTLPELEHPDVRVQFLPFWNDHPFKSYFLPDIHLPDATRKFGVSIAVSLAEPHSRGRILLRSLDALAKPIVDLQLFGDSRDLDTLVRGLQLANRLFASHHFAPHLVGPAYPPDPAQTVEEWEAQVRACANVSYHPVGTCRMGGDEASVVDPQLRVRGVDGLRIADCSIVPKMPTANTNAPAIMIGERAADFVLRHRVQRA
jgi:choline dehydrogenase